MDKIPLVDLKRQYHNHKEEIDRAINEVIESSAFVSRKFVEIFENEFAKYCGSKYCIATSSGTDALLTAFFAAGIGNGDEVITIANTFTATAEVLWFLGAKPIFIDIDPETQLMDASLIEQAITKKTKAICPVHLFGNPADMVRIMEISERHGLKVIEDCAHAHGATINDRTVGTFGDIGAYSFNPAKVLGAYGDAGAIITDNEEYAEKAREFINHGRKIKNKYEYDSFGLNMRMDGIQASILSAKLKFLNDWVKRRREIAALYDKLLAGVAQSPKKYAGSLEAFHLYVISVNKRDELIAYLKDLGVEAGIHYPIPLNLQKPYIDWQGKQQVLPETERASKKIVSLPIFPEMMREEVEFVARAVKEFIQGK